MVTLIDIAHDNFEDKRQYNPLEDPKVYKSEKTGRGPLSHPDWKANAKPVMTAYKLVSSEFKWKGLQNRVENYIHKVSECNKSFIQFI